MRRVLTAVAMVVLVACGARSTPKLATADSSTTSSTSTTEAPSTTSTSTTSTTAPPPRSTDGIQPGMLDAITSCEPAMKGATLDVVAVNGPYAAAILHKGTTVSHRSLTSANGRWYDGEHGQAACAPRVDEMPSSYPPQNTWGGGEYAVYFDDSRQGSTTDGTIGTDSTTLIVGISDSTVIKASMGGGYWIVLAVGVRAPGVVCAYDDAGRLVHFGGNGWFGPGGMPGYTGPTEPPLKPTECPNKAPAV